MLIRQITIIPTKPTIQYWEQSINNVIALKQYVKSVPAVFEALATVKSELLLHINEVGWRYISAVFRFSLIIAVRS